MQIPDLAPGESTQVHASTPDILRLLERDENLFAHHFTRETCVITRRLQSGQRHAEVVRAILS